MIHPFLVTLRDLQWPCHPAVSAGKVWTASALLQEHRYDITLMASSSEGIPFTLICNTNSETKEFIKHGWAIDPHIIRGPHTLVLTSWKFFGSQTVAPSMILWSISFSPFWAFSVGEVIYSLYTNLTWAPLYCTCKLAHLEGIPATESSRLCWNCQTAGTPVRGFTVSLKCWSFSDPPPMLPGCYTWQSSADHRILT